MNNEEKVGGGWRMVCGGKWMVKSEWLMANYSWLTG